MLTIALPTGRVLDEARDILEKTGLPVKKLKAIGRELIVEEDMVRYILAKPMDVPLYVDRGVADMGLVGSDVMWESGADLIELLDTGMGVCRLVVAGPPELKGRFGAHCSELMWLRVATKYPNIANTHFSRRGVQVEIVHLNGSIELAPKLGMTDCILDIVQTGTTLEANGLIPLETVGPVSLRLVASRKSASLRWDRIKPVIDSMREAVKEVAAS